MLAEIQIGNRKIGKAHLPLFVPDIGTFFNSDTERAEQLIHKLIEAGVEIVKGEILHDAKIALKGEYREAYYCSNKGVIHENYRALIERKVISLEQYEKIFSICKEKRIPFLVSVYDFEGADFAKKIGAVALKSASSNITHQPLISFISSLGLPVILDTGGATIAEIARAVTWAREAGVDELIIEHSPKAPPAPLTEHNLRFMETLETTFGAMVGLSDHHDGTEMLLAASVMGAVLLEKGVYHPDQIMDQDVTHGMSVDDVACTLKQIKMVHEALGSTVRLEQGNPHKARMGLVAKREIKAGEEVTLDNLGFAFPALGIPAEETQRVVGKKFVFDKQQGEVITWKDINA